ncbi:MAG: DUF3800 domain-containing protein [Candidatus Pacebacteria bacterium]|nr:DUF3800 domain-containing protein [Candidatus Paceibacterota bacterium]
MFLAKRDFIFIDESGDPGNETEYYILGLLHITDVSLKKMNTDLGALRYFGNIKKELKSTRLNFAQKQYLFNIIKSRINSGEFIKASALYIKKENFSGTYLFDQPGLARDATKFRHYVLRRLLEFHFKYVKPQSNEIEIIVDRFHALENKEQQLRNYLRIDVHNILPKFLHIIQADSRYVDLLQVADWVAGCVKEKFFTHPERNYEDLFQYIKIHELQH